MGNSEAIVISQVETVRSHFEQWRRSHPPRTRIPEELWQEAAALARAYGLNRTAQALGLGYYDLKKRAQPGRVQQASRRAKPAFVELIAPPAREGGECLLELESARGAKLRLQLRGQAGLDAAVLSSIFWDRTR